MTTNRCNLACKHCYQDAGDSYTDELTTAEAQQLISDIARTGFKIMIFSGGEPLMRPDIYELVSYARAAGLRPVFGTNGTLITPDVAAKLKAAGAAAMGISLDSLDEGKHDEFRGQRDAFALTLAGIENCRQAGLPYQLHTTITDWNRDEVLAITDFAVAKGAVAHYIFFLIPVGRGILIEDTSLEVNSYEALLRDIMNKQKEVKIDIKPTCAPQFTRVAKELGVDTRFARGCLAGLTYCIISPQGIVRPCAYMTEAAGDIRRESFTDIWQGSAIFAKLRTEAYQGTCGVCDHKTLCGGCRARAGYYHDGDILAEDSYCAHSLALRLSEPQGKQVRK
jgi:putative heme d1 biosynthesis radical SAM protein NirJ2